MKNEIAALRGSLAVEARKKLDERLSAIETALAALRSTPPLTDEQKSYLNDVREADDKLKRAEANISSHELNLANNYYGVFLGCIAVFAIISTIAIFLIQSGSTEMILSKAKRRIAKDINEQVQYESYLTLADAYSRLGVSWYRYYEPLFQDYKLYVNTHGAPPPTSSHLSASEIIREVQMARYFTDKGLTYYYDRLDETHRKVDLRAWHTQASLINQKTYHLTVSALFERWGGGQDNATRKNALKSAERCLELSHDKKATTGDLWYQLQEAASFAMVTLGDADDHEIGRGCLQNLLHGQKPTHAAESPPLAWRRMIYNEYFPEQSGTRLDPYRLGPMSEPT